MVSDEMMKEAITDFVQNDAPLDKTLISMYKKNGAMGEFKILRFFIEAVLAGSKKTKAKSK